MSATILDGRHYAQDLQVQLATVVARQQAERGRAPALVLVGVGDDETANLYASQVERSCQRIGLQCLRRHFPVTITETALRTEVALLGARPDVDGVVLLLPLPRHIRQRVVTEVLPPEKDVDGLGPRNAGNMLLGFPSFVPSTADAALELLQHAEIPLQGRHVVIVGRSNVGGKPAGLLFLRANATVTFCHSRTRDLASITRQADVVFSSAGQPNTITADMLKPGVVVLDAGMNTVSGAVVGDVAFDDVCRVASYVTPVPGGLGPLTNLMLIRHVVFGPR